MVIGDIVKEYIEEPVRSFEAIDTGHINRSHLVIADERYMLQCLNQRLYADHLYELEHNYLQYVSACKRFDHENGKWYYPEWIKDRKGRFFHRDKEGNVWRLYRFIPSDKPGKIISEEEISAIGAGLGKLHRILEGCPDIKNIETVSHLHDLEYHYRKFREQDTSVIKRVSELDAVIESRIDDMLKITVPERSNIHGDAKISNMLFEDGKVVGFIDLDTIMTGSVYNDIADCARSCCMDYDGNYDSGRIGHLTEGYEEGYKAEFEQSFGQLLIKNMERNRFMLGIRYYTDYLSQEGYFAQPPEKNIEKALFLLKPAGRYDITW